MLPSQLSEVEGALELEAPGLQHYKQERPKVGRSWSARGAGAVSRLLGLVTGGLVQHDGQALSLERGEQVQGLGQHDNEVPAGAAVPHPGVRFGGRKARRPGLGGTALRVLEVSSATSSGKCCSVPVSRCGIGARSWSARRVGEQLQEGGACRSPVLWRPMSPDSSGLSLLGLDEGGGMQVSVGEGWVPRP